MKRLICALTALFLFSGCREASSEMDTAMALREKLLVSGCSFTADITAYYGDEVYTFQMDCHSDTAGTLSFSVTEPVSIAGITGRISVDDATLTFDETMLAFPPLAGGSLVPVAGPWVFINTLRSGYLSACGKEGEGLIILADDSYADNSLQLQILTDENTVPHQVDIFWNQKRILSLTVTDFLIL